MDIWSFVTVAIFTGFIAICALVLWPTVQKPYENAEKLALKDDNDPVITPRHSTTSDKRTKT